jgi:hypothetical protein
MADAVAAALLASPKPQPALATLAVLTGMAACCNGSFHLRGARLNLYGVGIAGTGGGKDLPRTVAVAIAHAGGAKVLGKAGSGQGLEDALVDTQGMLCEIDEMAHLLAAINGSKAPSHLIELAGNLLKLFSSGSSGYNTRSLAQAQGRSAARRLRHPCMNIIGFATPEKLGESVGVSNVEDGLLGRLLFAFGQDGVKVRRPPSTFAIPDSVVHAAERVNGLFFDTTPIMGTANREVEIATAQDADIRLLELMREFDDHAMQGRSSFSKALLTRSFEKCQRIAGVLAVWDNPVAPVITMAHVDWAEQMVRASDGAALHFCGEYMHGGQVQADAAMVGKMFKRILNGDFQPQRANEITLLKSGKVAHSFLLRAAKLDKRRFDDAIGQLVDLAEIRRETVKGAQSNGKTYATLAFSRVDG